MTGTDPLRERLERSLGEAYRIEREIGGGGMSRVFLAEERELGRLVVVKVLAPEFAHALSAERFTREIRLSARLQHPNIVPVLTAGVTADVPYYTMPFIDGESLRARLDRMAAGEHITSREAVDALRDVARGLAYAHSLGVVHRDIKPENVLLSGKVAVVVDFGVAKAMDVARTHADPATNPTLTQSGVALGTPAYMSPEQATGDPGLDQQADVYAWGVVAYELLAGVHPFAHRHSAHAMIAAHISEEPRALVDVAPHLNADISALVMRCLQKDPARRPGSAREIVDALPTTISGDSVKAELPGTWSVDSPNAARRRPTMLTIGVLVLVLLGGGAGIKYVLRMRSSSAAAFRQARTASAGATSTSPAYDEYLRGKVRISSENRTDNESAIVALRQAVSLDATFAPAHAELARAYAINVFYFAPDSEKKALRENAEVELEKALRLDPNLGEAHFARALLMWTPAQRFPHEQAVQAYRQALALNPNMDEAHHQLALVLLHVGLFDEAQAEIDTALAINPSNTLARFRIGVIALYRGDFEQANTIFSSTPLERNPTLWAFQSATALFRLGREREATELIDRFLRDYPSDEGGVGNSVRAMMLAKAGRRREAEEAIAKAIARGHGFGHFHHTAYNIASAYALLGDTPRAIQYLTEAADEGLPCYPLFANDTQLDRVRTAPEFVALMTRLQRDWQRRKQQL